MGLLLASGLMLPSLGGCKGEKSPRASGSTDDRASAQRPQASRSKEPRASARAANRAAGTSPGTSATTKADERATSIDEQRLIALLRQESERAGAEGLPAGHPPIEAAATTAPAAAALPPDHPPLEGGPAGVSRLAFDAPDEWVAQTPSSTFRTAQFALPHVEGDSEDGQLVVFFFGPGQGGTVQDNLDRWRRQFTTPDGKPVPDEAVRQESFQVGSWPVTVLEVQGRFAARMAPGAPVGDARDNYRMIAAIIQANGSMWFVKALGPDRTMRAHRDAIFNFIRSAHAEAP